MKEKIQNWIKFHLILAAILLACVWLGYLISHAVNILMKLYGETNAWYIVGGVVAFLVIEVIYFLVEWEVGRETDWHGPM